jgi:adenylate kinase family enzyme
MILEAWVLFGPTGSGKTPLGEALERSGWNGRRCVHFDFGAELRRVDAFTEDVPDLTAEERSVIRDVLEKGALLEKQHFPIARKILKYFLHRKNAARGDLLVLNGWPRHLGQAGDLEAAAAVVRVILLTASSETIRERIRTNAAGDRSSREDDSPAEIERKFSLYKQRTEPLVGYYAAKGIPVTSLEVGPETSAADLHRNLLGSLEDRE